MYLWYFQTPLYLCIRTHIFFSSCRPCCRPPPPYPPLIFDGDSGSFHTQDIFFYRLFILNQEFVCRQSVYYTLKSIVFICLNTIQFRTSEVSNVFVDFPKRFWTFHKVSKVPPHFGTKCIRGNFRHPYISMFTNLFSSCRPCCRPTPAARNSYVGILSGTNWIG